MFQYFRQTYKFYISVVILLCFIYQATSSLILYLVYCYNDFNNFFRISFLLLFSITYTIIVISAIIPKKANIDVRESFFANPISVIFIFVSLLVMLYPEAILTGRFFYRLDFFPLPSSGKTQSFLESLILFIKVAGIFVLMVLGMMSRVLWNRLEESNSKRKLKFHMNEFIRPLIISPIIFLFFYVFIKEQEITLIHFLGAYQNGFFWETILYPKFNIKKPKK